MLKKILAATLVTIVVSPSLAAASQSPAPGRVNPTGIIMSRNSSGQVTNVTLIGGPGQRNPMLPPMRLPPLTAASASFAALAIAARCVLILRLYPGGAPAMRSIVQCNPGEGRNLGTLGANAPRN